jgi:hypothetical protein
MGARLDASNIGLSQLDVQAFQVWPEPPRPYLRMFIPSLSRFYLSLPL